MTSTRDRHVVFNSTVQGAVPDTVRGRVFTLLDVTWSAMRLLSLAIGGVVVDVIGTSARQQFRALDGLQRYH